MTTIVGTQYIIIMGIRTYISYIMLFEKYCELCNLYISNATSTLNF